MSGCKLKRMLCTGVLVLNCALAVQARGGGSGLNTVVIVNQNSAASCELGNYYCERRQVPPENVLRVGWAGGRISWSSAQFEAALLQPLLEMLSARHLASQVDYVVLSMDLPFQTSYGSTINSTTSALFYGLKDDAGPEWMNVTNSYAGSEAIFPQTRPATSPGYSFLATMLTAGSLAQAKRLVEQGVTGDGTCPGEPVMLVKTSDSIRNLRYRAFDNAIFNTRLVRSYAMVSTNTDSLWGQTNLLGCETGQSAFSLSPNTFVPGAMADNLTSFGGVIFGPNDQTNLLAFIHAGAAGSYGTVTEPSPNPEKFPDPQNYFYQARGFSVAECYYQSLAAPYEGLVVAEPLAAPFRQAAWGKWVGLTNGATLTGTPQLSVRFLARDPEHPLDRVDLFIDGKYFRALTNLGPSAGNLLSLELNGYPLAYTIPANANIAGTAAELTSLLNRPEVTNVTRVIASQHGDRIELHAASVNTSEDPFYFADLAATNPAGRFYRVRYLLEPFLPQLTSLGRGKDGAFRLHAEIPPNMICAIEASSDLAEWVPISTNLAGGPVDFVDQAAANYSKRFYRITGIPLNRQPMLSALGRTRDGFRFHVDSATTLPYTIEASSNLVQWSSVLTNLATGSLDFTDSAASDYSCRFYRAAVLPEGAMPKFTVLNVAGLSNPLLRIEGAVWPYVLEASSDLAQWRPVLTNLAVHQVQLRAGSSRGAAEMLSSFVAASRGTFLDSTARGLRAFTVNGTLQVDTWLELSVIKTNGACFSIAVTNQASGASALDLARQLVSLINSSPGVQGLDGLVAEDLAEDWFSGARFNLRARSPGLPAAQAQVLLTGSESLVIDPPEGLRLDQNLSDLQPRNHLYLTAGASRLEFTFPLDTSLLPDGYHELTAVAYEGSHVRTQTRTTVPVWIRNSALMATLTLLDLPETAPAQGVYRIEVAANSGEVSAIRLFSTGGLLASVTNQSTATFTVNGAMLGAGLHPFYAVVETSAGSLFRTQPQYARLLSGQ